MQTYYLYFVGPKGRIAERHNIDAPDDCTAIALADRQNDGRAMELWLGPRQVQTFGARPPAA